MGVPAFFRWLSKKYPKTILPVVEDEEVKVSGGNGDEVSIPVDITAPNPNGVEFDCLYLDMNGIVHNCTHPEGKPAPETEEEMMVEIFKYTERVVNMIRPRRLLLMAIDGVAPRAKMNQQRSRRFRSAQEAKEKEEAREESLLLWESMGKTVTDEMRNKKAWDSNAITPGTPFMDLLAQSLRYWVAQKLNTDPGWKHLEVIISDASVPGEGEHKIMDFIRRQRTNPGHDPNTRHVIYGLDADLIMLSLATHEPYFRVLREDVFFQDASSSACRLCGQEGHYAAQCTGEAKVKADIHDTRKAPVMKKPFIFLDVPILREYLEIELNIPHAPFPFDFERAIDDWVLLIFFVGNDFLPHLPSLEIREGAVDNLLKIWKDEMPRMGGYLTNHGTLEYSRVEIILEGLAKREDEIFRRRRETEERQEQNAKRRKLDASHNENGDSSTPVKPSASLQLSAAPSAPPAPAGPYGLPARPNFDSFESAANSLGFGVTVDTKAAALAAIQGTNIDVLNNRNHIRMANLSAAEMLKAEMMSAVPVNPIARQKHLAQKSAAARAEKAASIIAEPMSSATFTSAAIAETGVVEATTPEAASAEETASSSLGQPASLDGEVPLNADSSPRGVKRKVESFEDAIDEQEDLDLDGEEDEGETENVSTSYARKVNPDGTVEQEDTVKLWEPGYRERYYRQKFGVEPGDIEFRKRIATSYIEGMAWVLQYYYQGTPSWQWYYPYHFAPFAADFTEVSKMNVTFTLGQPFKPYEQLMGVFPSASRQHIPSIFQSLMTDTESPIIDFYPEVFEIDMNGKKMAWQGVALLPFIDQKRLLEAMAPLYKGLTDEEQRRNKWGSNSLFASEEHSLYPVLESLYGKRKDNKPVRIDPNQSKGLNGSLLPDPSCIPGATYYSPLTSVDLEDIPGDRSLSALYFFPKQLRPHRSVLLPGSRLPPRVLTKADYETIRRGGNGGGRNGRGRDTGFHAIHNGWDRESERGRERDRDSYYGGYGAYSSYSGYSNSYSSNATGGNRGRSDRDSYINGSESGRYGGGTHGLPPPLGRGNGEPGYGRPDYHRSPPPPQPVRPDYRQPLPPSATSSHYYESGHSHGAPPSASSTSYYGGYGSAGGYAGHRGSSSSYGAGRGGEMQAYNSHQTYSSSGVAGSYGGYGAGGSSGYGGHDSGASSGRGGRAQGSSRGSGYGSYGATSRGGKPHAFASAYATRGRGYGRY